MTIDEAIDHCYEVVNKGCNNQCALDHLQLARWLEELKKLKEDEDRFKF